ncbi:MAG: hypothetical protein IJ299_04635 [Oscillospiraceae bacterium]|nr:hypothetical protein [Oscillospiraceae bacterium]
MNNYIINSSTLAEIGDTIRDKSGISESIPVPEIPKHIENVYEAGKKAEYNAFWDGFQSKGTRTAYNRAFYMWAASIFKPKYDLKPTRADYMFMDMFHEYNSKGGYSLVKALEDAGVTLDTSQCANFSYMFYYSYVNEIGEIDTRSATSVNAILSYAKYVKKVERLILKDDGSQTLTASFDATNALKSITFEGTIGESIDFQASPLSKASITNIIEHLSDSSTGKTVTFKKSAREAAFTDDEWAELITTKPNWTFSAI